MIDDKVLTKFSKVLKKENLKLTHQRQAVLKDVMENRDHRECDEIFDHLKRDGMNVSRATVYRTIAILEKYGFVRKLELGDGRARYEYKLGMGHHDHMICVDCGKIIEFFNAEIEDMQDKICEDMNFKLVRHIHQLFGLCQTCQE
tara:strand:- start:1098 stop:1532 length:435 start_codon:yes stop_codon:yes gene_type:complete